MDKEFYRLFDDCEDEVHGLLTRIRQLLRSDELSEEDVDEAYTLTVNLNERLIGSSYSDDSGFMDCMKKSYKMLCTAEWAQALTNEHHYSLEDKSVQLFELEYIDSNIYQNICNKINMAGLNKGSNVLNEISAEAYYSKGAKLCEEIQVGTLNDINGVNYNINNVIVYIERLLKSNELTLADKLSDKLIADAGDYQTQVDYLPQELVDKRQMLRDSCQKKVDELYNKYDVRRGDNHVEDSNHNVLEDNACPAYDDNYSLSINSPSNTIESGNWESVRNTIQKFEKELYDLHCEFEDNSPEIVEYNEMVINWCKQNLARRELPEDIVSFINMNIEFSKLFKVVKYDGNMKALSNDITNGIENLLKKGNISMANKYANMLLYKVKSKESDEHNGIKYSYDEVFDMLTVLFNKYNQQLNLS